MSADAFSDSDLVFNMPKNKSSAIKVIGVGGGGCNAVDYMFSQNIQGIDCIVCNTDAQHLEHCTVINKVYLGVKTSEGYGAGAKPERGEQAALESEAEIKNAIEQNTKILFITAGMGGGTGTGASPIIAKIAKEMGILVIAVVTKPFELEGPTRMRNAVKGIEELKRYVDSILVINNENLVEQYGDFDWKDSFVMADQVLEKATIGIAQVITNNYKINIDLEDVRTVLADSGTAIMGYAEASGEDRAQKVIEAALKSPLLDDDDITGAKNVLLLLHEGTVPIKGRETKEICNYIRSKSLTDVDIILGWGEAPNLGDNLAVTIIATGFSSGNDHAFKDQAPQQEQVIYPLDVKDPPEETYAENESIQQHDTFKVSEYLNLLEDETPTQKINHEVVEELYLKEETGEIEKTTTKISESTIKPQPSETQESEIKVFNLDDYEENEHEGFNLFVDAEEDNKEPNHFEKKDEADMNLNLLSFGLPAREADDDVKNRTQERIKTFKEYNYKFKNKGKSGVDYGYTTKKMNKSRTFLRGDGTDVQLSEKNSFLHDSVD